MAQVLLNHFQNIFIFQNCGTTTTPTTTARKETFCETDFECEVIFPFQFDKRGGKIKLPQDAGNFSEESCSQCFCSCASAGAAATEICCGEGLVFNPGNGACDFPENNPACD